MIDFFGKVTKKNRLTFGQAVFLVFPGVRLTTIGRNKIQNLIRVQRYGKNLNFPNKSKWILFKFIHLRKGRGENSKLTPLLS